MKNIQRIRHLLEQVSLLNKKNNDILDATGGRFNMFRVCGVNHYEKTHSAIIAEFLDPCGSHGLKTKFLECFVDMMGAKNFNCKNARVYTEYVTSEGQLDVLIEEDGQKSALIIENKIYADDQQEQLKRYESFAKNRYGAKNYKMFYLTLFGHDASDQSGKGVNYTSISYEKIIIEWLEKCIGFSVRHPLVRETIIQYINHLKQLTNQDMDTENQKEISDNVIKSEENLNAYFLLRDSWHSIRKAVIETKLHPVLEKIAKGSGLSWECSSDLGDTYSKINFWHAEMENQKLKICFEFIPRNYCFGFYYHQKFQSKTETIIKIAELFNDHYKSAPLKENPWWCCNHRRGGVDVGGKESFIKMYNDANVWVGWLDLEEKLQTMLNLFNEASSVS
ncbi:hypothetical protein M2103_001297 [Ereboglobus sp. PH5-5]|uniref:PDDEXK-like family protein n=1 Tax=Ereboglobus sp. PH5-5 TaxID=2940529 RepID=UPI0024054599|nr:PD-(D/E)XK nuclease family protein [Ereboglobus sp. PH5-5]MDF9833080.1 hypothetical protein [Ereboglobus sp. PH5-5]